MKEVSPEETARALVKRYSGRWRQERERAARLLDAVRAEVPRIAERYGAKRVFLFGSLVWGGIHARTDVDLAIEGLSSEHLAIFASAVSERLDAEVDLVPLERAPESLRTRVLREGELIYPRS